MKRPGELETFFLLWVHFINSVPKFNILLQLDLKKGIFVYLIKDNAKIKEALI